MKEDFVESMEAIVDKKVQKSLKERTKYEREFSSYLWMRTLQDLVYYKMSSSMNEADVKAWSSFEVLVNEYSDNNTTHILTPGDLDHLRKLLLILAVQPQVVSLDVRHGPADEPEPHQGADRGVPLRQPGHVES
jgi:hypothetical protein